MQHYRASLKIYMYLRVEKAEGVQLAKSGKLAIFFG